MTGRTRLSADERELVAAEFPLVRVSTRIDGIPMIRTSEWVSPAFDSWSFDCRVDELASAPFSLAAENDSDVPAFALELLTRCQRHVHFDDAGDAMLERVMRRHRDLHDLSRPLVRADLNHALDVRRWLLRLDPAASPALQLAALFHDIERLVSEPDARVEHLAADYQQFKDRHARTGAGMTRELLLREGVAAATCEEVVWLITEHERKSDVPELALLNDADALSFFSLNSPGYADYFGAEQLKKKVAYSWNRMSERARAKLSTVRLRVDVREALRGVG